MFLNVNYELKILKPEEVEQVFRHNICPFCGNMSLKRDNVVMELVCTRCGAISNLTAPSYWTLYKDTQQVD